MPDVVVAGQSAVPAARGEWGVFHDVLIKELKWRFIAKRLEGPFAPVAGHGPELL